MLVLKRRLGQSVLIGEDIEVVFISMQLDEIKLGFHAPENVPIMREELLRKYVTLQDYKSFIDNLRSQP